MSTKTKNDRLNQVESHLTPQEWAILMANDLQKHSTGAACLAACGTLPFEAMPGVKAYQALEQQAEARHPDDLCRRTRLADALNRELEALKFLLLTANCEAESAGHFGLLGALKLSILFGVLAVKGPPTGRELAKVEACISYSTELLEAFFAYDAAIESVQQEHFAGHAILLPAVAAHRTGTNRCVETAVASVNPCLSLLRRGRRGPGRRGGNLAIELEPLKARAATQAEAIAQGWVKLAHLNVIPLNRGHWPQILEGLAGLGAP